MDGSTTLHTTEQAAKRLRIHPGHLRRLAIKHGIGQKWGRDWMFTDEDIEQLEQRGQKQGRPKKKGEER